jgi:Protein of unknown function (DUF3352)
VATVRARRRLAVLAAVIVAGAVVAAIALAGGGGTRPPATGAARLIPSDALVYLHASTDRGRGAVKRAEALLGKFPSWPGLRDSLLQRLSSGTSRADVSPWLGKEAALALLNTQSSTAGSLIVLGVRDEGKARSFLDHNTSGTAFTYRGTRVLRYGQLDAALTGAYLVVGQDASIRQALDLAAGHGTPLAENATYRAASHGLPSGRVLDAYVSADGVRRLLEPQGGLLGAAGALLDNPALQGSALSVTPEKPGARLTVHSILDPKVKRTATFRPFVPSLVGDVPKDALAYVGVSGLDRVGPTLLNLAGQLVGNLAGARQVLTLFKGEVALVITPRVPNPVLTLIAPAGDQVRAAAAFAQLQGPLAKLLAPKGSTPVFQERTIAGVKAFSLRLGAGRELDYAIFDGKLVASTNAAGIADVKTSKQSLADNDGFKATLRSHPKKVTSLVFLDFNQLLTLGEQTGLSDSPAYNRVREDLHQVRAVGASTTGGERETTAELRFQIP